MKMYVINYTTKCKRGSRDYSKLVETEDIEAYIKKNFNLGYSSARGSHMFLSATEVVKLNNNRYNVVTNGMYYYCNCITFFESELVSAVNTNKYNSYYTYDLKKMHS
jgi:hypothetical protein